MLLDNYVWRARIAPATVALIPFATFFFINGAAIAQFAIPSVFLVAGAAAVAELVRTAGRRVEPRLVKSWGGMPTTRMLRATTSGAGTVRRRAAVEALTGAALPTTAEQLADPIEADAQISSSVRIAIVKIRAGGPDAVLLGRENSSYGFLRNSLGLKTFALLVAVLATVVQNLIYVAVNSPDSYLGFALLLLLDAICLAYWVFGITGKRVTAQADIFADRFFAAVEAAVARGSGL